MSDRKAPPERPGTEPRTRQRLAALASMLLFLAALAMAGWGLLSGGLWRLIVALLTVAITIVGAWYALSRRGPARLAGAMGAVVGLGGFIAVTVTAEYRGVGFALALVGAGLSAGLARYALEPPVSSQPVAVRITLPEPRQAVLILNPRSGGGKAERFHLAEECRTRGIRPVELGPGDDLEDLAVRAIDQGASVIGMAGGDGSQALVASLAASRGVPYVCVPAGTRNHLALDLGIDRDDVVGALDAFSDGVERVVDLAEVNGRVFVNNASMGLYARIVSSPEYRDAKLRTATSMLPDMLGPGTEPFDLRFVGANGSTWPYAHMLLVSNNPYELESLLGTGRRPSLESGQLGIAAARIESPSDAVEFMALESAGRIGSFHGWAQWAAPSFRVDSGATVDIGIDGEATTLGPPLLFTSRPGCLRVWLPASARIPVQSATGGSGGHRRLPSLVRVAAGRS